MNSSNVIDFRTRRDGLEAHRRFVRIVKLGRLGKLELTDGDCLRMALAIAGSTLLSEVGLYRLADRLLDWPLARIDERLQSLKQQK